MDKSHSSGSENFRLTHQRPFPQARPAIEHNGIPHSNQSQPYHQPPFYVPVQPATSSIVHAPSNQSMSSPIVPSISRTMIPPHLQSSIPHSQQIRATVPHSSASHQYKQQFPRGQHMREVPASHQTQQQASHGQQVMQGHNVASMSLNPQHMQGLADLGTHVVNLRSLGHHPTPDNQGNSPNANLISNPLLPSGHLLSFPTQQSTPSIQNQDRGPPYVPIHLPPNYPQGQSLMLKNALKHVPSQHQQTTTSQFPTSQTGPVGSAPKHTRSNSKQLPQADTGTSNANHETQLQAQKNIQEASKISLTIPVMGKPALSGDTPQKTSHHSQQGSSNTPLSSLSSFSQPTSTPPGEPTAPSSTAPSLVAADRDAGKVLSKSLPALKNFLWSQRIIIRGELMRMNEHYGKAAQELQEEVRRVRQAEEEAIRKQEDTARAIDDFVAKAVQVEAHKEVLEQTCKSLHEKNVKLNRTCLQQNKLLDADASAQLLILYQDRIAYLETRLRKYEDVPATPTPNENPLISKNSSLKEEAKAPSVNLSSGESGCIEAGSQYAADAIRTERQLRNAANIFSELFGRGIKSGPPKSPPIPIKEESLAKDKRHSISTVSPLSIDITGEDINGDNEIDDSIARTLADPHEDALFIPGLPWSPQQEQPLPSASSTTCIPPQMHTMDTGRQRRSNQDDGPPHKRSRSEPEPNELSDAQRYDGENIKAKTIDDLRNAEHLCEARGNGDSRSAEISQAKTNVDISLGDSQEKTEVEETMLKISKSNMAPAEVEANWTSKEDESTTQMSQIGQLHLQLMYHIHKSGVRDCRVCQYEGKDETEFIFPATTPTDELVKHAISVHSDFVVELLKLSQAELIRGQTLILSTN